MAAQRIAIVDDDPSILELTTLLLRGDGFRVDGFMSGEDALAAIQQNPPDLVISDVEMPGLNGLQLLQKIGQDSRLRNMPVMLLSGHRISPAERVRGLGSGGDDYLVKPFTPEELIARVRAVLRRSQINLDANPLTRLPGNSSILWEIQHHISNNEPLAVLYADLNNFKAFNDRYGFVRGDDVIKFTAHVLLECARGISPLPFAGHIGGDDFVMITRPESAEDLCRKIIRLFDQDIAHFYDKDDVSKGGFEVADRRGIATFYPIMGIAIGVVSNAHREIRSVGEVSQIGAEVKKFAKSFAGSYFVVDKRKASQSAHAQSKNPPDKSS